MKNQTSSVIDRLVAWNAELKESGYFIAIAYAHVMKCDEYQVIDPDGDLAYVSFDVDDAIEYASCNAFPDSE